ncbi:unnamed protein product, partial [marine sediment metagenome]
MKTQLNTLTPEECDNLLLYLMSPPGNKAPPRVHHRNYTMALLMLDAGLRIGELVQLRQDQLWFAAAAVGALTIEKHQAKNKHERTIPITIRLDAAIHQMHREWWSQLRNSSPTHAFYQTLPSRPLTTRQVRRIITSAGEMSLHRHIRPHLLRHTFATRLIGK